MNIVAFGCSSTYGEALGNERQNDPSPLAWPQKLADIYKCTVTNMGECGTSNKAIMNTILNYDFKPDDVVFVCWTFFDRFSIITETHTVNIGIWQVQRDDLRRGTIQFLMSKGTLASKQYEKSDKVAKAFFENMHDTYDMILDFYRNCMFAYHYLQDKGIPSFHTNTNNGYTPIETYYESNPWFDYKRYLMPDSNFEKLTKHYPRAEDGIHPGPEAHEALAHQLHHHSKLKIQIHKECNK
tara:strand:- start:1143 stop:1862 length:720 start_codon:yes stop_codon:yes gene_type:complete